MQMKLAVRFARFLSAAVGWASVAVLLTAPLQGRQVFGNIYLDSSPPRQLGPGSEVHLYNHKKGVLFTSETDDRGDFSFPDVPDGEYELVVTGPEVGPNRKAVYIPGIFRDVFVPEKGSEEPVIAAIVNGATNSPDYMPQGNVTGNGVYFGYGNNLGPDSIIAAPGLPLQEDLGGFQVRVVSGEEEYPAFPIYVFSTQFAVVFPSGVPPGPADVIASYNGEDSLPYGVFVSPAQPGVFTLDQSGQRYGIFTDLNYNLITINNSGQPGNIYIAWMTGLGDAPDDAQGGVFDKRQQAIDSFYRAFLGGVEIPEENIHYAGTDSSAAGLDLFVFTVPAGAALGCGSPFVLSVETAYGTHVSVPVLFPISENGGPCGDEHSLSSAEVGNLFTNPADPYTLGTFRLRNSSVLDGDTRTDRLFASYEVLKPTKDTYVPSNTPNTCIVTSSLPGVPNPSAPERATLPGGNVRVQTPGAFFDMNANNNGGPFSQTFLQSSTINDGNSTVNIQNLNVVFPQSGLSGTANLQYDMTYNHNAARSYREIVEGIIDEYASRGEVPYFYVYDEVAPTVEEDVLQDQNSFFGFSQTATTPRGSYSVGSNCHLRDLNNPWDRERLRRLLAPLVHHFPEQPRGFFGARFFFPDRNRTEREGIINHTEEAFEGIFSLGETLYGFLGNTPPIITGPGPQALELPGGSGTLDLVVSDQETPASFLLVTAASSNQEVMINGEIFLGGSGSNRTISFFPSFAGKTTITVTVRDEEGLYAQHRFEVTVGGQP